MDLQLAHVRALGAVARHASFSRAAAELGVTQPAVSMQVRQLEGALGLPLLERVGKRAFPTRAGEILLAHAARAFHELDVGVERVQQLRGVVAGRVRVGTSNSISIYLLPPFLRRFRSRYAATELVIVTGNAPDIARAVVDNDLDVGIVSLPVRARELAVTPFFDDELVAIAPPLPRWRRRRTIGAEDLAREPLILFEPGPADVFRVSLPVVIGTTLATAVLFVFVIGKALGAQRRPVATGVQLLVGALGETITPLAPRGQIRVRGEIWEGESPDPLEAGTPVEITRVRGLSLEVRAQNRKGP